MNVFFTCATDSLVDNFDTYDFIIKSIKKSRNKILYNWIADAKKQVSKHTEGDTQLYYDNKLQAIDKADVVIVEGSIKSFSVGHQITLAIKKAKPVLFLYNEEILNDTYYLEGIKSKWLVKKSYKNKNDLNQKISKFLELYKDGKKVRFHLVITQEENSFLEDQMRIQCKSKTDIIRDLINGAMEG